MLRDAQLAWPVLSLVAACTVTPARGRPDATPGAPGATPLSGVIDEIEEANTGIAPEDRVAKYCKMAAGPLPFYRGSNHLFWRHFAGDARMQVFGGPDTRIWVQGDLHTDNHGAFEDDDGTVIYDLDDFDEAMIADYQWDLWRMAVSIALVAERNGGFSPDQIDALIDAYTESYLDTVADHAGGDGERPRSFTRESTVGPLRAFLTRVEEERSRARLLDAWTRVEQGRRVLDLANEDLDPVPGALAAELRAAWPAYVATTRGKLRAIPGYFTIKDLARRRDAGLGSLGVPRYYVLIEGDSAAPGDDRILDVKRQGTPSGYPYIGDDERALTDAAAATPAERVITAYRAMSRDADDHLGWLALADGTYSVRERSPHKQTFPTRKLDNLDDFRSMAEQWGELLATAHARSDRDYRDELIDGSFDDALAARTEGRHHELRALVREVVRSHLPRVHADYRAFVDHVSARGLCPRERRPTARRRAARRALARVARLAPVRDRGGRCCASARAALHRPVAGGAGGASSTRYGSRSSAKRLSPSSYSRSSQGEYVRTSMRSGKNLMMRR